MTIEKCIEVLKGFCREHEHFLNEKDNPFLEEIEAINTAFTTFEELKEAKRLLKQTVAEFDEMADREPRGYCPFNVHYIPCNICPFKGYDEADRCGVWQHRAEVLKLIGDDGDDT